MVRMIPRASLIPKRAKMIFFWKEYRLYPRTKGSHWTSDWCSRKRWLDIFQLKQLLLSPLVLVRLEAWAWSWYISWAISLDSSVGSVMYITVKDSRNAEDQVRPKRLLTIWTLTLCYGKSRAEVDHLRFVLVWQALKLLMSSLVRIVRCAPSHSPWNKHNSMLRCISYNVNWALF